ncbi:hypothetical protein CDO87_03570 [Sagittula sp. P11]|uniref:hypothetical protein n=1 Tax=Sagittula sp. P11 TaxID=2009329 RepID=UPI000C2CF64A|nr:hypothetical protein [Sagittula sp. P11]AUC52323.1 hypothetical protein CDO87_03570 [Sagittula sp. P11]
MADKVQTGRLAFREEGTLWVAYYALPGTMKGAVFLGSIQMAFVQDWTAKEMFMSLMRDAVTAIIREQTGTAPEWPEPQGRPAPEHERGGRA